MQEQLDRWIEQAKKGDQQAFYQLYQQFKGKVYAVCWRLLANNAQAEDACQEAFVRAWQQLPTFRGESSFGTWLHTLSSRAAIDVWRKDKVLRLVTSDDIDGPTTDLEMPVCKSIEQAIAKLPSQARAVFVLFAIVGYQHDETAELLAIAEGSSKAQYHRARQLLRGWIDEN